MRTLLSLLLLVWLGSLPAQRRIYHYPSDHGLSYGTVQDMAVTTDGYLWVGGQTSLRRYDGTDFQHFGHRREDSTSMSNDYVHVLYEAPDQSLWIGHNRGLSSFDFDREQFRNFRPPPALSGDAGRALTVKAIVADRADHLRVGTTGGLYAFDRKLGRFVTDTAFQRQQLALQVGSVNAFLPTGTGDFWLAAGGGVFLFRPATGALSRARGTAVADYRVGVRLPDGDLVFGQDRQLLRLREAGEDSLRNITTFTLPLLPDRRLVITDALALKAAPVVFAATTSGLCEVDWSDPQKPIGLSYLHDPEDDQSLAHQEVHSLARTPDDILLVGTRRGVDRISLAPAHIDVIRRIPDKTDLCSDLTKGSAVDAVHQLLLVGTQEGLSIVDLKTQEVTCYTPENLPGLHRKYIFNVDPGPRPHTFWIGYRQGGTNLLVLDDPDQPYFEEPDFAPHDLSAAGVYEVVPDGTGLWWLATSNGLFSYDYAAGRATRYAPDPNDSLSLTTSNIFSVLHDRQGRLWVGTRNGGLCLREVRDGKTSFRCFRYDEADPESLPSDMVLHLFEDKMGRIWISNPEALGVYLEDGRFRTFGKADDLPFALCYGVFADVQKRLWAAFGGNFTQFSLEEDGRFVIHKVITRNDGLAGAANAQYGWSLLPDGRLALSQRYGLNLLHPDSVTVSPSFPPVLLTDFRLFNQPVGPGATAGNENTVDFRLPHDINRLDRVELPPHHDFISLEFSGREFRPGEATYYAYRMVGLQEEWQDLEERNFLSFPKLPPGDYRLELRTGNSLLQWSDDVRTLDISLAAPWYRRWWALLLFGLLGAGAVYLLGRERERQRQRVEAARVAERENFRRRSARDFHDEAGNHLSRVSLLTELARRQVPGEEQGAVAALLSDINANVQVIREGMRDFIWALDPDNDNAYELALRLKRFGQDLFTHHPAEFSAAVISDGLRDITLRADQRRHLILLCKEAMHNSFKHAAGASKVHFSLTADRRELRLRWKDDGPGYDPVVASDGSGLKNMRTRAEKIGASLRVDSRNGNDLRVDLRY